jgi:HK97 gp10 family phage protein
VKAKVTFRGQRELERALRDLSQAVSRRLARNAVLSGARVIASATKARAPVGEDGLLKRSIRTFEDRTENSSGTKRMAYAGTRLYYAYWVEYGTVHMSAQPFLRPAIDENFTEISNRMGENLASGFERETAKYGK